MSKRHTIQQGSQPIPPVPTGVLFQENLVFYVPLNQGELFDYISGEHAQLMNGASAVWDANEQRYLVGFDCQTMDNTPSPGLYFNSAAMRANLATCGVNGLTMCCWCQEVDYRGEYWNYQRQMTIDSMVDIYDNVGAYNNDCNCCIDGYRLGWTGATTSIPSAALNNKFMATTFTTTARMITYLNGVQKRDQVFGKYVSPLSIGIIDKVIWNNNRHAYSWHCYVNDIRIYNRVLSQAEVQQVMNNII